MKHKARKDRKSKKLARTLGIPLPHAAGLREFLYGAAIQYAPRGDIGCLPDDELAEELGWDPDDAGRLIEALVESGLLDRTDSEARLIVHGWSEHSEDYVDRKLANEGMTYADGNPPRRRGSGVVPTSPDKSRRRETSPDVSRGGGASPEKRPLSSSSSYASSSPSEKIPPTPREWASGINGVLIPEILRTEQFRAAWGEFVQHRRERKSSLTRTAAQRQLSRLQSMGPDRAIRAIEWSITQGWLSINEPGERDGRGGADDKVDKPGRHHRRDASIYAGLGARVDADTGEVLA